MDGDFIPGILTSDLLDSKIFLHICSSSNSNSTFNSSNANTSNSNNSSSSSNSSSLANFHSTYTSSYSARVQNTKSYHQISKDVLSKWTFPVTPGANCPGGIEYTVRDGMRYTAKDVRLSRSSILGPQTLLGPSVRLSDSSHVTNSILGPNVSIDVDSKISGSHLWENVSVGRNCTIEKSIIGRNVKILSNVKIEKGCLIDDDCIIGPDVTVKKFSRVGRVKEEEAKKFLMDQEEDSDASDESEEDEEQDDSNANKGDKDQKSMIGQDSKGYLWSPSTLKKSNDGNDEDEDGDQDEDEEEQITSHEIITRIGYSLQDHLEFTRVEDDADAIQPDDDDQDGDEVSSVDSLSSIDVDSDLDSSESESGSESNSVIGGVRKGGEMLSAASLAGDLLSSQFSKLSTTSNSASSLNFNDANSKFSEFKSEALASLDRALEESHTIDNAAIELKTLRMASNVPLKEVKKIVIEFFLQKFDVRDPKGISVLLDRWGPLIKVVSTDDQVEALGLVQSYCALHAQTHLSLFVPLLKKFYNDDIFSDESILEWWKSPISRDADKLNGGEKMLECRKNAEGVVRFIAESGDDDDDDDEEEEEDEDQDED